MDIVPMEIILEFEPIVKLVCEATKCKHNLMNSSNTSAGQMLACNLKQISITSGGVCGNYEAIKNDTRG